ncbi:MAG: DUF4129 domain-containing protein [Acidimicrobiia bacterium]
MTVLARVDTDAARDAARQILRQREFQPERTPKPLGGPVQWIGDRLNGIADWLGTAIEDVFSWIFHLLPGVWGPILGVVICVALATVVVWLIGRNRVSATRADRESEAPSAQLEDPRGLEREADAAAQAGQYALAVRLRYRAGLIRLDRADVIDLRPWNTSAHLTRRLDSRRFDRLTDTFDAVTYGAQPATNADVAVARTEWPELVTEMKSR